MLTGGGDIQRKDVYKSESECKRRENQYNEINQANVYNNINPHIAYDKCTQSQSNNAKPFLLLGIIFNLSVLGFFKYTDFFLENFNLLSNLLNFDLNIPLPHILLPLALSFVTFQQIAFLIDCYKRIDISDMEEQGEKECKMK